MKLRNTLLAGLVGVVAAVAPRPAQAQSLDVKEKILSNGMRVLVVEDEAATSPRQLKPRRLPVAKVKRQPRQWKHLHPHPQLKHPPLKPTSRPKAMLEPDRQVV